MRNIYGAFSAVVLAAGLLAACVSAEQDGETCEGYGFKAGSDAYANCKMELDSRRSAKMAAVGAAMQSAGNNYSASMRPTNCTYTGNRYAVYQSCY